MNTFQTHFSVHRRFRNGIFLLATIITILLVVLFSIPEIAVDEGNLEVLTAYQQELTALKKQSAAEKKAYETKPFNPNFISDYKAYILGIPTDALNHLQSYRAQDKWVNSPEEFQKVTGISDTLLDQISPLFKFPEWKKKNNIVQRFIIKTNAQKGDLNTVTAIKIQQATQIPEFVASRIVKYRNRLEGFVDDIQLQDVYGLYGKQMDKVLSLYTVKTPKRVNRVAINTATVAQLVEIPYFNFEMALTIRDFIKENGDVKSFYEFDKIKDFPVDKISRISLYLTL